MAEEIAAYINIEEVNLNVTILWAKTEVKIIEEEGPRQEHLGIAFLSKINIKIINEYETYFYQQLSKISHSESENVESTQEKTDIHQQQWRRDKELKKCLKMVYKILKQQGV